MNNKEFLETLDGKMAMKPADWVEEQMGSENFIIIDLRSNEKFGESHITNSVQCDIKDLPNRASEILSNKETTAIMVCNGSIQSAMAVMYLRCEGYLNSYNMGGGFSSWLKNERPIS